MSDETLVAIVMAIVILAALWVVVRRERRKLLSFEAFRAACVDSFEFLLAQGFEEREEKHIRGGDDSREPVYEVYFERSPVTVAVLREFASDRISVSVSMTARDLDSPALSEIESLLRLRAPDEKLLDASGVRARLWPKQLLDLYSQALEKWGQDLLNGDLSGFKAVEAHDEAFYQKEVADWLE